MAESEQGLDLLLVAHDLGLDPVGLAGQLRLLQAEPGLQRLELEGGRGLDAVLLLQYKPRLLDGGDGLRLLGPGPVQLGALDGEQIAVGPELDGQLLGPVGHLLDAGQPLHELDEVVAGQQEADRAPVLDLVQDPNLGGEGRLPLLHPALGLLELRRQDILAPDQVVEPGLVLAEAGVVLQQLGVELNQDGLEPGDLVLRDGDLVPDAGLLGVDLRQLRLIALNLGLEVVEGVRVSSARKECDQEAEDHGQGDGPEESMSHSLF